MKAGGTYSPGYTSAVNDSSLHRNHVHVTVYGNAGTGFQNDDEASGGSSGAAPGSGRHRWRVATWSAARGPATCPPLVSRTPVRTSRSSIGTAVRSTNDGIVEVSKDLNGSYGRYLVIRDRADPKVAVYYAHLSVRGVRVGQQVSAGQVIGRTGSTGNSSGPHLHYEIRIDGNPVNPMPFLAKHGVTP